MANAITRSNDQPTLSDERMLGALRWGHTVLAAEMLDQRLRVVAHSPGEARAPSGAVSCGPRLLF